MNTKLAGIGDYTPAQLLLLSMMAGGAGFGGMRLLNDLHDQISPQLPSNNSIKLELPNPHKHKSELESTNIRSADPNLGNPIPGINKIGNNMFLPYMAAVGGLPIGFLGAKHLYDKYQENEYNKQIEEAKKQYTNQLALAQQTTQKLGEEETPNVDLLCQAMAEELEKNAGIGKWIGLGASALGLGAGAYGYSQIDPTTLGYNPPAVPGLPMKTILSELPEDPATMEQVRSRVGDNARSSMYNTANKLTGNVPKAGKDLWMAGTGIGAVGLLGYMIHNHMKKKEKEQKAEYPTNIEYAE